MSTFSIVPVADGLQHLVHRCTLSYRDVNPAITFVLSVTSARITLEKCCRMWLVASAEFAFGPYPYHPISYFDGFTDTTCLNMCSIGNYSL